MPLAFCGGTHPVRRPEPPDKKPHNVCKTKPFRCNQLPFTALQGQFGTVLKMSINTLVGKLRRRAVVDKALEFVLPYPYHSPEYDQSSAISFQP